jgi:hypothetical protein
MYIWVQVSGSPPLWAIFLVGFANAMWYVFIGVMLMLAARVIF